MPNRAESESAPGGLFESVLARALELRDEGRTDWLREACAACPELERAVREAVAGTKLVAGMWRSDGERSAGFSAATRDSRCATRPPSVCMKPTSAPVVSANEFHASPGLRRNSTVRRATR